MGVLDRITSTFRRSGSPEATTEPSPLAPPAALSESGNSVPWTGWVRRLWRDFFRAFRDDEASVERPDYLRRSANLHRRLAACDGNPDADLATDMLACLASFQRDRFRDITGRLDVLLRECSDAQRKATHGSLTGSWQRDEMDRIRTLLARARRHAGLSDLDPDQPIANQLEELLRSANLLPAHSSRRRAVVSSSA